MSKVRLYCTNECTDEKEEGCDDDICCHDCSEFEVCKRCNYTCGFLKLVPDATSEEIMTGCKLFGCKEVI